MVFDPNKQPVDTPTTFHGAHIAGSQWIAGIVGCPPGTPITGMPFFPADLPQTSPISYHFDYTPQIHLDLAWTGAFWKLQADSSVPGNFNGAFWSGPHTLANPAGLYTSGTPCTDPFFLLVTIV